MIDLHSHILPGLDDGASDLDVSLEMARIFQSQGVTHVACTPHILPGVYHNTGEAIRKSVEALQSRINEAGIELQLLVGADNHVVPDFVAGLERGHLLTLGDTKYVLVEPPHHVAPPRLSELFFNILVAGYVPILTHPERLTWVSDRYQVFEELADRGVWIQITSGSLVGRFGKRAKYWAERMICEGRVHILASDAHNCEHRPPDLERGRVAAERLIGSEEAHNLVAERPRNILLDTNPDSVARPVGATEAGSVLGGSNGDQAFGTRSRGGLIGRMRHLFTK